jgi:NADPH-dependent curcumin reductase CurA
MAAVQLTVSPHELVFLVTGDLLQQLRRRESEIGHLVEVDRGHGLFAWLGLDALGSGTRTAIVATTTAAGAAGAIVAAIAAITVISPCAVLAARAAAAGLAAKRRIATGADQDRGC